MKKAATAVLLALIVVVSAQALALEDSPVFLTKWGSYGSGDGQFRYPYGVTVDNRGNVYVADIFNCRIQKFR